MIRIFLVLALLLGGRAAFAACELDQVAEVPVEILGHRGLRPIVTAKINGVEGRFLFDTGAGSTMISAGSLAKFGLAADGAQTVQMKSMGKPFDARLIKVKEVSFAAWTITGPTLVVVDEPLVRETDGAIGEKQMTDLDMEIDLPHRTIRFFRPSDCSPKSLAYWAKPGQARSIPLDSFVGEENRIFGPVAINGVRFRALFDTGAADTGLTRKTAESAGVHPGDEGVAEDGFIRGVGPVPLKNWKAQFDSFAIDDETIAHPIFGFSDKTGASADLLIGADFFKRHRVYVAKHQQVMAFTDEGVEPTASAETTPAAGRP